MGGTLVINRAVSTGTRVIVKLKTANIFIVEIIVNTTSVEEIAEIKIAIKCTERLANIGLMMVVREQKTVPSSTKKHMSLEKDTQVEPEAKVTQEAGAEILKVEKEMREGKEMKE